MSITGRIPALETVSHFKKTHGFSNTAKIFCFHIFLLKYDLIRGILLTHQDFLEVFLMAKITKDTIIGEILDIAPETAG